MWLGGPCRIPPRPNLHQPFHEIGQDPAIATRASRSNNPGSLDSHVPMLSPPLAPDRDSSSTSRHPLPRGILHRLRNHDSRSVARKGCQAGRSVRPSWVATCLDPGGRWGARDPPLHRGALSTWNAPIGPSKTTSPWSPRGWYGWGICTPQPTQRSTTWHH